MLFLIVFLLIVAVSGNVSATGFSVETVPPEKESGEVPPELTWAVHCGLPSSATYSVYIQMGILYGPFRSRYMLVSPDNKAQ